MRRAYRTRDDSSLTLTVSIILRQLCVINRCISHVPTLATLSYFRNPFVLNFVKFDVKFTQNFLKIFSTFFKFWENFLENLLEILIKNYLEIQLNFTSNYSEILSENFKIFSEYS